MGLLDVLLGRTKPAKPNLDRLFGLPGARVTLEATEGLVPTGSAGVCFKPVAGQAFGQTEAEIGQLLSLEDAEEGALRLTKESDQYGYRWLVLRADDFDTLVTRVHVANSTLEEHGYGPQLLCSVFAFARPPGAPAAEAAGRVYLVYLYKRGTFYPFVPLDGERRDNEAELRLKAELGEDLAIEPELDRWFPIWDLPVR
ncbi:MAG TPA: hypothetical protein VKV23_09675 [Acidimicrobiales bacterium]|nr:hypothetical protein [Acidimicrobiales bacterium]